MFTGIIESLGEVKSINKSEANINFTKIGLDLRIKRKGGLG